MKPSVSFGIKTVIIIAMSVGLALAFNATRPNRMPLVHDPKSAAQVVARRGEISIADAALLFETGKAIFVDARETGEYALGHVDGAVSLDPVLFGQDFPSLREQLEGATTIVAYCDGEFCELSRELAAQLKGMGLQDVRVLKNGWTLWRDQGLPTAAGNRTAPEQMPQEPRAEEQIPMNATLGEAPAKTDPQESISEHPAPTQTVPMDQQLQPASPKEKPAKSIPSEPAPPDQPLKTTPMEPLSLNPTPPTAPSLQETNPLDPTIP